MLEEVRVKSPLCLLLGMLLLDFGGLGCYEYHDLYAPCVTQGVRKRPTNHVGQVRSQLIRRPLLLHGLLNAGTYHK